jgi:hypothetical protein
MRFVPLSPEYASASLIGIKVFSALAVAIVISSFHPARSFVRACRCGRRRICW